MSDIPDSQAVLVNDDGVIKHMTWAQFQTSGGSLLGPQVVIDAINNSSTQQKG